MDKDIQSRFLHSGNTGDVLASLPAIREYYRKTGVKPVLYLRKGVDAFYYEGATHPVKDDTTGKPVMLNQAIIDMLIPLLKEQDFLLDIRTWDGEDIGIDLGQIRETNVGMPGMSINRWYFYVYPDLACDLTKEWITVPDSEKNLAKNKIIITRTERYNNTFIDYSFLKPFEDELIFSGTMREYNNFCMQFDLNIKKLTVTNFLDIAQAIKQSRFHISNQTMAFQISEGLKHPRLLELCDFAPNVIVFGENVYDYFAQQALEYYFDLLYKKTSQ
jgi:hypothetical protein